MRVAVLPAGTEAPQQLSLTPEHQALHVHLQLLCTGTGPVRRPGPPARPSPLLLQGHSPWSESERSEERPEESRLSARSRSRSPAPAGPRSRASCCCRLCCSLRSFSLSRRARCSCSSSFCRVRGSKGWGQLPGGPGTTPTRLHSGRSPSVTACLLLTGLTKSGLHRLPPHPPGAQAPRCHVNGPSSVELGKERGQHNLKDLHQGLVR